ncbi:PAS domain S-box protein [Azospirillum sp.]|uniref:PAS domain S-box protein n=1 Tax=Azospirillum sp. TaxID=34012 RepID=UPI003D752BD4
MRPLTILFWVSLLLPPAVAGAIAWRSYEQTLERASAEGVQMVSILREHAMRVFEVQEQVIAQIDAHIAGLSWDEIEASQPIHARLKALADASPHIDGLWLVRPEGRTAASADFYPMPFSPVAEREYFQVLKERDVTHLGRMIQGRLKGNLNFNLSRRRTPPPGSPAGTFDGVILVTTSIDFFAGFWRGVLGEQAPHVVGILRTDGEILARYPTLTAPPPRIPADSPFYALVAAGRDTGQYSFRSLSDGRERIYFQARLGGYPAYVTVGLDRAAVMEPWRRSVLVVAALAAATALLLAAVVQVARRREDRLHAEVLRRRYAESTLVAKEEHLEALQRAEAALRASEERFRSVYEQAAVGIERLDLDGRIVDANETLCAILGYSRAELVGRSFEEITDPVDLPGEREPLRRLLAGEVGRYAFEKRYIRKDGSRVWVRVTSSLVRGGEEGDTRLNIVEDVSRRQAVETALRNSEERFRRLFEAAPFGVMMVEPGTLRLVAFNDQTPRILGYSRAEFARLTVADIEVGNTREQIVQAQSDLIASGARAAHETRLKAKDGAMRDVIVSVLPVEIDGKAYIYSGIVDITDRKRIERELAEAKEAAEQANLAKSKFLAAASHDLRQPLQSLFLFAHVLEAQVAGSEKALGTLGALHKGLEAMKGLLDSLLDVSRLDAGSVTADVRSVQVADLLDALDTAYARIAANKALGWSVEPCDAVVHTDPTLLAQLLRNFVENAIRYTPRGGVRVTCHRIAKDGAGDDRLAIEVHDTGIGIPAEHMASIWEEFHQVGNPERDREKGLGLGLAIVRRLSELLGHPVTARSEPGKGSVFAVEVPLDPDGAPPALAAARSAPGPGAESRLVVVVEDDSIVLTALEALLTEWGYEVLTASSGAEAMERIRADGRLPDVLVSDYRLRAGEVGTQAIRLIRQTCGHPIPGVLLTGETAGAALRDAAAEGLLVVHKPVLPTELDDALRQQMLAGA